MSIFSRKWFSLLSGLLSSTVCGMLLYAFSVLVHPLQEHFAWSYSEVGLAFSICYFTSSFFCFFTGRLIQTIGVKIVAFAGGVLVGTGFLLNAFVTSKYQFYIFYGVICGVGCSFLYLPALVVIPKWWPERYIFTTGFAVVGLGIGSIFMGPLSSLIIVYYSWREVFIYCGLGMLFMGILSAVLISDVPCVKSTKNKINYCKVKITKIPSFWLLYLVYFCSISASVMLISQLSPYLVELGYSAVVSGYFVSVFAMGNTLSRLVAGIIAEGKNINTCLAITLFVQSLAMFFLYSFASNVVLLGLLVFAVGWSLGTSALLFPSITRNYFGEETYAVNYGLMLTSCSFAGLLGSFLSGLIKDLTGLYFLAFLIGSVLSLIAALVLLFVKSCDKVSKIVNAGYRE